MLFDKKEDAAAAWKAIRQAGEASTVKRVVGPIITERKQAIVGQMSRIAPDLGTYAHYAGALGELLTIEQQLDMVLEEGSEARSELIKRREL